MAKVFVTGGNGFIGTHLVEALVARGDEVTCLVRATSNASRLDRAGARTVHGDVTEPDSLRTPLADAEIVYHLAGTTKALHKQDFWNVNEQGVRNLLSACAERETPPVVISISSLAAAGPAKNGSPLAEDALPQPVSNYGRSKLAGEAAAREFADRVPITILRPPVVYGEGDPYSINVFRPIARLGFLYGPGLRRARFSMIHAADMAQAMILAAEKGARLPPNIDQAARPSQGIYFAAGDEHPTFREWAKLIGSAFGRRRVLIVTPYGGQLIFPFAAISELFGRLRRKPAIFNLDKAREIFAGSWWCSDAALRRDTGFTPAADLYSRLQQTADWYRRQGWV